jgi:hypothetical protein
MTLEAGVKRTANSLARARSAGAHPGDRPAGTTSLKQRNTERRRHSSPTRTCPRTPAPGRDLALWFWGRKERLDERSADLRNASIGEATQGASLGWV